MWAFVASPEGIQSIFFGESRPTFRNRSRSSSADVAWGPCAAHWSQPTEQVVCKHARLFTDKLVDQNGGD
jgi:hypothetical protein